MKTIIILSGYLFISQCACSQLFMNKKEKPYIDTVTIKAAVIVGDQVKVVGLYRIEYYDYLPHPADIVYRNEPFGLHHVSITDFEFKDYREPIMFYKEVRRSSNIKILTDKGG